MSMPLQKYDSDAFDTSAMFLIYNPRILTSCLFAILKPERVCSIGVWKNKATLAELTPNTVPGWVVPSITRFVLTSGNCDKIVIVLPAGLVSDKLKLI